MGYIDYTVVLLSQIVVQLCMLVGYWGSFFLMRTMQGSRFERRPFGAFQRSKIHFKRKEKSIRSMICHTVSPYAWVYLVNILRVL